MLTQHFGLENRPEGRHRIAAHLVHERAGSRELATVESTQASWAASREVEAVSVRGWARFALLAVAAEGFLDALRIRGSDALVDRQCLP
jgi:hypothetical protein